MRSIALAAIVAVAILVSPPALACTPSTSPSLTPCLPGTDCVYVVNDLCQISCLFSVHIYQESNNKPGLQRADAVHDDTCGGLQPSDLHMFG